MRILHSSIFRVHALHCSICSFILVTRCWILSQYHWFTEAYSLHSMFEHLGISCTQIPLTSALQTFISLRCLPRNEKARILCNSFKVFRHQTFQSLASTHQQRKHKQSPEYTKSRQETSRLIAHQRFERLRPFV